MCVCVLLNYFIKENSALFCLCVMNVDLIHFNCSAMSYMFYML